MLRSRRIKRASPEELYKQCRLGADCPPDVKNKYENNTIADILLKIFGSIAYFGGLGIGTGRGTGGASGYRPIGGTTVRPSTEAPISRPTIPLDPLGVPEVINVDTPSIVPLGEGGLPDTAVVIDSGPGISEGPGILDVEVITTGNPTSDITVTGEFPTITTSTENTTNILDVLPGPPPPKRVALDAELSSYHTNIDIIPVSHVDPDVNIFVDPLLSGDVVGYEEIPLDDISIRQEFEIDANVPKTSTPREAIQRGSRQFRDFYKRYIKQVRTSNPDFIGQTSRAVTFEFENPAFERDVSLQFEKDVNELSAPPDEDFADIRTLTKPALTETPKGTIRVSRLGQTATMKTRSGLIVGQTVHFYYDLSTIDPVETIELQPLGEFSGESIDVNTLTQGSTVNVFENPAFEFPEEELLDDTPEAFSDSHLVISYTDEAGDRFEIPGIPPGISIKVFVDDYAQGVFVQYPDHLPMIPPTEIVVPQQPLEPVSYLDSLSSDYYLHPSLYSRKRKRKYSELF
ncbi:L2 [Gammapapillomavirus sp.]|uniref:L2 n=1 Tax=Gammapapillomavirus sp. TaxID=2049444 RepID=UPI000C3CCA89|nr:L2 [Gammapapillomavirus sp.]ATQ38180.1 L2 [Gammapapillomavirus sp.]